MGHFYFWHIVFFICGVDTIGPSSVRPRFQVVFAQCDRLICPDRKIMDRQEIRPWTESPPLSAKSSPGGVKMASTF